jgi:hypothetical protein
MTVWRSGGKPEIYFVWELNSPVCRRRLRKSDADSDAHPENSDAQADLVTFGVDPQVFFRKVFRHPMRLSDTTSGDKKGREVTICP